MIRQLTPEDYQPLISLWQESGLEYRPSGRDAPEAVIRQMCRDPGAFWGYFTPEGRLIGSIIITHDGRKGWINRVAVHPEFRNRGIAAKLLDFAQDRLIRQGIRILAALIYSDNTASLKLFEKSGFELCLDIRYLRKKLSPDV